jgi:hypothetical protein
MRRDSKAGLTQGQPIRNLAELARQKRTNVASRITTNTQGLQCVAASKLSRYSCATDNKSRCDCVASIESCYTDKSKSEAALDEAIAKHQLRQSC